VKNIGTGYRATRTLTVWLICCVYAFSQEANSGGKDNAAGAQASGKQIFASHCAACHGLDGRGSERAPNIAGGRPERLSTAKLAKIVSEGVPNTGMPSFASLGPNNIRAVVHYVRLLQGKTQASKLRGDPENGKTLFFGMAGCSKCHAAGGSGTFIGSDLSEFASTHSAAEIRAAVLSPTSRASGAQLITVTTKDGHRYTGTVRNEDNFSLQLQSSDGTFHLFMKSNLQSREAVQPAPMPGDYGSKLSSQQLDDLVSYLYSIRDTHQAGRKEED